MLNCDKFTFFKLMNAQTHQLEQILQLRSIVEKIKAAINNKSQLTKIMGILSYSNFAQMAAQIFLSLLDLQLGKLSESWSWKLTVIFEANWLKQKENPKILTVLKVVVIAWRAILISTFRLDLETKRIASKYSKKSSFIAGNGKHQLRTREKSTNTCVPFHAGRWSFE